jgi:hypothetical protein
MAAILKVHQRAPLAVRRVAAPGPNAAANAAASAVTMGLLLRGKGSSAADVLTTEQDASLAEDDVTLNSFGLDHDTRMTSEWCHGSSALCQRSPTPAGSCR